MHASILFLTDGVKPAPQTQTTLFPLYPTTPTAATEKLSTLFASLRESLVLLQEKTSMPSPRGKDSEAKEKEKEERKGEKVENERLQNVIEGLRVEIGKCLLCFGTNPF